MPGELQESAKPGRPGPALLGIARILFTIFIVLFLASLIFGLISGRHPPTGPPM